MAANMSSARAEAGAVSSKAAAAAHATARTSRRTLWVEVNLLSFEALKDRVPGEGAQNPQGECILAEERSQ